jgi:hypothetical protein
MFMAVVSKGILALVYLKNNIATVSAVASIGATVGDKQLTTEAYMTISAFTGTDDDFRSVCKHKIPQFSIRIVKKGPKP